MLEEEFQNKDAVLNVKDRPQASHWVGLSLQYLFTMFGATVLTPTLAGIDPRVTLVSSGSGTAVYLITAKGKIPVYLGSNFVFIAAVQMLVKSDGYPAIAQSTVTIGLVYLIVSLIIKKIGSDWLDKILPPVVVGPIVMATGSGLAANAASNVMYNNNVYDFRYIAVALITLGLTIFYSMFFRDSLGLVPVLLGTINGYLVALAFGVIDLTPTKETAWSVLPNSEVPFIQYEPKSYLSAITTMTPTVFIIMTEHIDHLMVLNKLTKRNFFQDPDLSKTLVRDGLAQTVTGFVGGSPVTNYDENIGALAIVRVYSVFVIGRAAMFAVASGFAGKLSALILGIPGPVISGISFILFGMIAASGLRILIDNKINFGKRKNLLTASVTLVIGTGGLVFKVGAFELSSTASATVLGIVLSLILSENTRNEEQ